MEIIGKWYSYSSLDSTKKEYCEFKPDGIFVEYKNVIVKDRDTKYVLYGNELSMANGKEKDKIIMKFKVSKESYGLFLRMTSLNTKNSGDAVMWVKLLPWKS
ncbi:MAG: hypothetical protein SGJ15_04720 [Bacteroidota bacterium]|nr:hypothetical protein [Bacteroidota bacterium]